MGTKRTHVVLDNLEQLLPKAAHPLAGLLAAAPSLRIIATSREPLRIAGEAEFDLPPLDEPEAVTLFIERARAVRPGLDDSPAVHELVRRALGDLQRAIDLTVEGAQVALADGWRCWAAMQLHGAAALELSRGHLDTAEEHALAALDLNLQLGANRGALSKNAAIWAARKIAVPPFAEYEKTAAPLEIPVVILQRAPK